MKKVFGILLVVFIAGFVCDFSQAMLHLRFSANEANDLLWMSKTCGTIFAIAFTETIFFQRLWNGR